MSSSSTSGTWLVKSDGPQVESLRHRLGLPTDAINTLVEESSQILSLCGPPGIPTSAETGLALGYVQSGKTMSFTMLIAMARDNNYQLIVVIAGTQNVLVKQSEERLNRDLQIKGDNSLDWRIIKNPSPTDGDAFIKSTLNEYKSGRSPYRNRRTGIVVVTKNPTQLGKIAEILEQLPQELKGVPTLIVDDEADQAGMNTEAKANQEREDRGEPAQFSKVYSQLLRLKQALPHHTYIQYTATPQAPLFISRQDDLSPNFIKLLTPGEDYTGGDAFFTEPLLKKLVIKIPTNDIPTAQRRLETPPESLQQALRVFFIGVAEHLITRSGGRNRSMMVHPSQRTDPHEKYHNWVGGLKKAWLLQLDNDEHDPERLELVEKFRATYNELYDLDREGIKPTIIPFDTLLEALYDAIDATQVRLLNATPAAAFGIEWHDNEYFILVGGQVLSRGFTVEGLTVTYMPRPLGTGVADTMQQWARFFGYKRKYIHLCRIYLIEPVIKAFRDYVLHEADLHEQLKEFDGARQLNSFQRRVELPFSLTHLTRRAVMSDNIERYRFGGSWVTTQTVQGTPTEIEANRQAIQRFVDKFSSDWQEDLGDDDRTLSQRHLTVEVKLEDIIRLLRSYTYLSTSETDYDGFTYLSTDDANTFDMLADNLAKYSKKNPDAVGVAYRMSPNVPPRVRTAEDGKIKSGPLFQGENPSKKKGRIVYPGDREIKDPNRFSIQIYSLSIKNSPLPNYDAFVLAVWVPPAARSTPAKLAND